MSDCIFCKIASGEFNTEFEYEDDHVVAFRDLSPQAPIHILIVPKAHYENIIDHVPAETLASMAHAAQTIAERYKLNDSGFRCIMNTGSDAGQTVMHLHMHLLAGCPLGEGLLPA